jgi:hypothetical protein
MPSEMSKVGEIDYEIILHGQLVSKKNLYMPLMIKGRVRMIKNSALQAKIDEIACQVPADMRGLMLVHPDVRLQMTVAHGRGDQDGAWTLLCDILKDLRVIRNDSIAQFNGRKILEPCVMSDHWRTVLTLTPTQPTTGRLFTK